MVCRTSFTVPGANRSMMFCDGKGMKKSRNLQEIPGLFYNTVSKKQKRRAVHHIYALYLWRFNLADASRGVSPLRDSTLICYLHFSVA